MHFFAKRKVCSSLYAVYLKRGMDIVFSFIILVLLSPLLFLIGTLIKLESKGPVFYKAQRFGYQKKLITILKFRTMHVGAEKKFWELLKKNTQLKKEWEVFHKFKNDPRCTKIGKFLRKTSLDELPQFLCALKGDLSIVGPRPHHPFELEKEEKNLLYNYASKIFSVKPGLTGIWQTSGRNHLSYEERIKLESLYVEKQSFLFDLYLILKTIPALLTFRGAF